ncbi:MAG: DUF4214 domain-containing protein [Lachnospiraceae bacterium]|nr:DUF4214 domain-containing protein [Lachnospiraceae bacterium]
MKVIGKIGTCIAIVCGIWLCLTSVCVKAETVSENTLTVDDIWAAEMSGMPGNAMTTEAGTGNAKYLFLGDSTVTGYCDYKGNQICSYPYYFQQLRKASADNVSIGGATFSTAYQHNIVSQMDSVNLSQYDVVFFQFGINDFIHAYPLGSITGRDSYTVYGAINTAIDRVQANGATCYCITPFYYEWQDSKVVNENEQFFTEYLAAIKKVCQMRNVTVIDFNTAFGITKSNFYSYYIDSVHPNQSLHRMAGEYLNQMVPAYANDSAIQNFVVRLYSMCLSRTPDSDGLQYWEQSLVNQSKSGAEAAWGFFGSDEFVRKNISNEEYVELLYLTMLDRSADAEGKAYWVNLLDNGVSRMKVFQGFAESTEFGNICDSYSINRGNVVVTEGRDRNIGVTQFVARLYTEALGRKYDVDGLNDWCNRILDGTMSVTDVSTTGFFCSQEFLNKQLDNEEYVKVLYRTFLGREPEEAGLQYWMNKLESGVSREEIIKGFSYSQEFKDIMKAYGL